MEASLPAYVEVDEVPVAKKAKTCRVRTGAFEDITRGNAVAGAAAVVAAVALFADGKKRTGTLIGDVVAAGRYRREDRFDE